VRGLTKAYCTASGDRIAGKRVGAVRDRGDGMAGALVEIWLTVSALSSLVIILIAIGHSDMRREKRLRPRPLPRRRTRRAAR